MTYGLLPDSVREFGEYVFGGAQMPFIPYQEDGNWEAYLPRYESQSDKYDTCCCTVFGAHSQIEIMMNKLYN